MKSLQVVRDWGWGFVLFIVILIFGWSVGWSSYVHIKCVNYAVYRIELKENLLSRDIEVNYNLFYSHCLHRHGL